jgi:uncharacterized membrane protein YoaK (UPF0700 family)
MDEESKQEHWASMILLLTWAAGSIDAIGYVGLGHVFTANMTGNTVLLGMAIGQGKGLAALRSLLALLGFAGGAVIASLIVDRNPPVHGWTRHTSRALLVETIILAVFTVTWHLPLGRAESVHYLLIFLSAIAMGIQSATMRAVGLPGVVTTYITGTLTSLMSGLVRWRRQAAHAPATGVQLPWEQRLKLQGGLFAVYGAAAVFSAALQTRWPGLVSYSPLIAMVTVVVFGFRRNSENTAQMSA